MSTREFLEEVSEAHSAQPTLVEPITAVSGATSIAKIDKTSQFISVDAEELYSALCANFEASAERAKVIVFNTASNVWGHVRAANAALNREAEGLIHDLINPPHFPELILVRAEDGLSVPLDKQHCTPYIWDHVQSQHWNWGFANTFTPPGHG